MSTRLFVRMAAPNIAVSLLLLGLGILGGWYVHHLEKSTAALVALDLSTIQAAEQVVFAIDEVRSQLSDYLLTRDPTCFDGIPEKCAQVERWLQETEALVDDDKEIELDLARLLCQFLRVYQVLFVRMQCFEQGGRETPG